jgi:hypothetical protein
MASGELTGLGYAHVRELPRGDRRDELDDPTVWVAADLSLRVAQHRVDAVELNLEAESLEAFLTSAVGR